MKDEISESESKINCICGIYIHDQVVKGVQTTVHSPFTFRGPTVLNWEHSRIFPDFPVLVNPPFNEGKCIRRFALCTVNDAVQTSFQ